MMQRMLLRRRQIFAALMWSAFAVLAARAAGADEPLHVRIDGVLEKAYVGTPAPVCNDEEFVRRVYLDLTGMIPSVEEARGFLADSSPDKRARLIDKLLASPAHARHMTNVLDVMLMERRPDKHVNSAEWRKYLLESLLANKPFDQLAREILSADGVDPAQRPAAKFYLDREAEPNLLTRDIGRLFFGMDLQCAQCHDHPLIDDYYQSDYYGIFAFVNRTSLFTIKEDKEKKQPQLVVLQEKAEGDTKFKSVFTGEDGDTDPRLPGGPAVADPAFPKGEEYEVKPDKDVRPIPKYSRRLKLADLAASGKNRAFNRNIVNRLWAQLMGRGLVDPPDLHHSGNPPSNPALLAMLADEFVAMQFDMRALLRELALTRAYQRSIEPPSELASQAELARQQLSAIEQEQAAATEAVKQATDALSAVAGQLEAAEKEAAPLAEALAAANTAAEAAKKSADEAQAALAGAQKQLAAKREVADAVQQAAAKASEAAKILPDEKDLAAAAATFAAKSDALAAEVTALAKVAEEKSNVAQQQTAAHAAAAQSAEQAAADHASAQQKATDLRSQRNEAVAALEREQALAAHVERRIANARQLIEYGRLAGAAQTSQQALQQLQTELAAAQTKSKQIAAELPQKQVELAAAQTAVEQTSQALATAKAEHETKQKASTLLADAAAAGAAAQQKLPEDQEVAQSAEKLQARSTELAAELATAQEALAAAASAAEAAAQQHASLKQAVDAMTTEMEQLKKRVPELAAQLPAAQEKSTADASAADEALAAIAENWTRRFALGGLKPLDPEQFGWSMLTATGMFERQRAAEAAELEKNSPLSDEAKNDPAQVAARAAQVEQAAYDKLAGNVNLFVNLFGAGAGQPQEGFFATVDQALFMANGGQVRSWLSPGGNNLTDRLNKLEDPAQLAEELYMSVLTRKPAADEVAQVRQYLETRPNEKAAAVQEMAWALLTSAEFRFSH